MINLINSNNFNSGEVHETDILIIGSGINCLSFIDFFNTLNKTNKRITVIEKGEIKKDLFKNERADLNNSNYSDNFQNDGVFEFNKKGMNQSVSGNSSFWGGRFVKLDKEDFVTRKSLFSESSTYLDDLLTIEKKTLETNTFFGWIKSIFWPKK